MVMNYSFTVNVTLVMEIVRVSPEPGMRKENALEATADLRELGLQTPRLAVVGGDPDLAVGSCDPAVLRVREFDDRYVSSEHCGR